MSAEEWRSIPGFPGYEVSDLGNLRSLKPGKQGPRVPVIDRGYRRTMLSVGGVHYKRSIHQLVALAFIGPVPDRCEVRHLDGNRANNVPANLAYGTSAENRADTLLHGTHNMARKTECLNGHPFDEANTKRVRLGPGGFARQCRTCNRERARARRALLRARLANSNMAVAS